MRSRGFAVAMGLVCGALAVVCGGLLLWALGLRGRREALPDAVQAYREGAFERALPGIEEALAAAPERMDLVHLAGMACLKLKRFDQARGYFIRLRDAASGAERAKAELRLAAVALRGPVAQPPSAVGAQAGAPVPHSESPDLAAAVEHLKTARAAIEAAKAYNQLPGVLLLLADVHQRRGDAGEAEACLDALAALPPNVLPAAAARVAALRQLAARLRKGDAASLADAWPTLCARSKPAVVTARPHVALALGLHAGDPALPEAVRRTCLATMEHIPEPAQKAHGLRLRLSEAAAWSVLGHADAALEAARKARGLAPKDPAVLRVLASACLAAAAKSGEPDPLREEGLAAWRAFLAEARVPPKEQRQVCLALASAAWNADRKDEARQLLQAFGLGDSPLAVRMAAITAIEKRDAAAAVKHLRRLEQLEGPSKQLAELLKPFAAPPEIGALRVNGLHRYDPRPVLIASFVARAIGSTIAPESVSARLDGAPIQPIVTRGELFYRPERPLAAGEHKLEVAVADSLGQKAERSLPFIIEADSEPPAVIGIAPAPDSTTPDTFPVVSFRCTDPSGIALASLSVVFGQVGEGGQRSRDLTIVSQGIYQVSIKGSQVTRAKGSRADFGFVAFQPSQPLAPGKYRISVTVDDTRGNRCSKEWTFQCAP